MAQAYSARRQAVLRRTSVRQGQREVDPKTGPGAKVESAPPKTGAAMKKPRTKYSAEFKANVALATVQEHETVAEIARRYRVHANQICKWKQELLQNMAGVFEPKAGSTGSGSEASSERLSCCARSASSPSTYIPMAHRFVYLGAIMDWHSRRVFSWRPSNTLDTSFWVEALQETLSSFGTPEIFNTDQGTQFTSRAFTSALRSHGMKISMDGKGRCLDNIFVERLWRSVKHEDVYLHAYANVAEARSGLARSFDFYSRERPHQALGYQTPDAFDRGLQQTPRACPHDAGWSTQVAGLPPAPLAS